MSAGAMPRTDRAPHLISVGHGRGDFLERCARGARCDHLLPRSKH